MRQAANTVRWIYHKNTSISRLFASTTCGSRSAKLLLDELLQAPQVDRLAEVRHHVCLPAALLHLLAARGTQGLRAGMSGRRSVHCGRCNTPLLVFAVAHHGVPVRRWRCLPPDHREQACASPTGIDSSVSARTARAAHTHTPSAPDQTRLRASKHTRGQRVTLMRRPWLTHAPFEYEATAAAPLSTHVTVQFRRVSSLRMII